MMQLRIEKAQLTARSSSKPAGTSTVHHWIKNCHIQQESQSTDAQGCKNLASGNSGVFSAMVLQLWDDYTKGHCHRLLLSDLHGPPTIAVPRFSDIWQLLPTKSMRSMGLVNINLSLMSCWLVVSDFNRSLKNSSLQIGQSELPLPLSWPRVQQRWTNVLFASFCRILYSTNFLSSLG
jgi:hypothetical protein